MGDSVIATMRLQKVFQRAAECRVIGNLDPFDWSKHLIEMHREASVRRTDVAEQHGFTCCGHRFLALLKVPAELF